MSSEMNTFVHVYNMNVRTYIYVSNPMLVKWAGFFYLLCSTNISVSVSKCSVQLLFISSGEKFEKVYQRNKRNKNFVREKLIYSNTLRCIIVTKTAVCFALNLCLVQWHTNTTRESRWDITNNFSVKQQQMRLFVVPCSVGEFAQF